MLAAMNGHTSTVKLLLDMGSDINAQVYTLNVQPLEQLLADHDRHAVLCVNIFLNF